MDMSVLIGEPPSYRWARLLLLSMCGVAGCIYALNRGSTAVLAVGLGTIMIGAALFCRPLGYFSGFLRKDTLQRLVSSPLVLCLWVGGWVLMWFGMIAGLAL